MVLRAGPALARGDVWAARLGPVVLALLAIAYYSSYFANGLNLGGEGGTTAVLAQRLMEGQRPIVDTFLGYNVLWFLPVTWIFSIVGPDYLAMKAFFFVLAGLSGLLAWAVVLRVGRSGLLALAVGAAVILIPGMLFRNYMGFLAVANQLALVSAFAIPASRAPVRVILIGVAGLLVGVTALVRVELGVFVGVIWTGLLVLALLDPRRPFRSRWRESLAGGLLGVVLVLAVHAPFVADAHRRGYAEEFYYQYTAFFGLLRWEISKEIEAFRTAGEATPAPAPTPAPANVLPAPQASEAIPEAAAPTLPVAEVEDGRRPRPPIHEIVSGRKSRDRFFSAAFYLPVLLAPALALGGFVAMGRAVFKHNGALWQDGLAVVITTGCALTLFPQYAFFRPDTPHISEFMVPFLAALACATVPAVRVAFVNPKAAQLALAAACVAAFSIQCVVHFGHAFPKESAGTAAARKHAPELFVGQNNVRARLRPKDAVPIRALHDAILAHSQPGDWVVALPYSPTINFMTDRPSYLWDLYTDNTLAGPEFDATRIAELERFDPAVIVIDHRPINKTEESRFPNWAPQFYQHLKAHYELVGDFLENEVFVRKTPPPDPARPGP